MTTLKGQCECGAVAFEVDNPRQEVTFCHCGQCRRTSGHFWAATNAQFTDLTFTSDSGLKWFESSDFAKRGFCKDCGSSLFYRTNGKEDIAIAIGALNQPTGLTPGKHIFVADKGDYYDIADGVPQLDKF